MGMHNILQTSMTCPHCNTLVNVEIEMRFGNTSMLDKFVVGDQYKWVLDRMVQNGGRPEKGDLDGEGYTECPQCRRDFFVKVIIRGDRIQGVQPDTGKAAYIQASDVASLPPLSGTTHQSATVIPPAWKPEPRTREIGQITFNERWNLTPSIEDLLEKLVKFGVDVFSTVGGNDYTILVPLDLAREQQDEVDGLIRELAKEANGNVDYVDWYPHGWKFRIHPREEGG
jgi:hypothetical protein